MRKEEVCAPAEPVDTSYIYRGGLDEDAVGVDVVIEDDDADHDPHAEQEGVLAAETTRILPKKKQQQRQTEATESGFHTVHLHPTEAKVCVCVCVRTHGVSSMILHTLAMVLRQSVVFSSGRLLFCRGRHDAGINARLTWGFGRSKRATEASPPSQSLW